MTPTHRIRRLTWRARAPTPADAFALRALLRERGDAVQEALSSALDRVGAGDDVVHLPQLVLQLDAAELGDLAAGLEQRVEAAVNEALAKALPDAPARGRGTAGEGRAASRQPSAVTRLGSLRHYLATGGLDWSLAGLSPEAVAATLQQAAIAAMPGSTTGLHAALLAVLGSDDTTPAALSALVRWLRLLPAHQRRVWVVSQRPRGVLAGLTDIVDAETPAVVELQALWLLGSQAANPAAPLSAAVVRWLRDALQTASLPASLRGVAAGVGDTLSRALGAPAASDEGDALIRPTAPAPADLPATDASMLVPLAGLVLLHPYLPRLFTACGLWSHGERSIALQALPRACTLLHGLACGGSEAPEFDLPLVKLLLGLPPEAPLRHAPAALSDADRTEATALLEAVCAHWTALRGTGIDGLRLSFLQRRGLLDRREGAWHLRLQTEPFDMLLGLLPWSISPIRLPWMTEPLTTDWPTP